MSVELDILNIPISEPRRDMTEYSWTIYGVGGFGKSGLASRFPEALFFCFEAGQNALRARKLPIGSWKEFKQAVAKLVKAKQAGTAIPYRNFIIDTADVAWKYCVQYVCKLNGWLHPSDAEWGKGWQACADEWFFELDNLMKLGTEEAPCTVINILHDTDKEFKPKGKEKYNKVVLNIPQGGRAVVYDKVDFVIHCSIESFKDSEGNCKEKRIMRFRDNGEVEAKSRLAYMPDTIEYGENADEAYQNILNAFSKAIIDEFGEVGAAPKKSRAAKSKKEEKVEEPYEAAEQIGTKETAADINDKTLEQLRKEIEDKFMALYTSHAKTSTELLEMVKEYTGKSKVSEIDDIEKAQDLLVALG